MTIVVWTEFHITYTANLSATTKIETLIITVCWTEFHIKKHIISYYVTTCNLCQDHVILALSSISIIFLLNFALISSCFSV